MLKKKQKKHTSVYVSDKQTLMFWLSRYLLLLLNIYHLFNTLTPLGGW